MAVNRFVLNGISYHGKGTITHAIEGYTAADACAPGNPKAASVEDFRRCSAR